MPRSGVLGLRLRPVGLILVALGPRLGALEQSSAHGQKLIIIKFYVTFCVPKQTCFGSFQRFTFVARIGIYRHSIDSFLLSNLKDISKMCVFSIDEYLKKKKKFRRERRAQNPSYVPVFKVAHKHLIWRMFCILGHPNGKT